MGKSTATSRSARAWSRKNSRWLLVVGRSQEPFHRYTSRVIDTPKCPASHGLANDQRRLLHLEVEHIQHEETLAVHQHNISTDHSMHVANWRRRQISFNFDRARIHLLLQTRRQCPTHNELALQPRRQPVSLCQAWGKITIMSAIPVVQFAVVIAIVVPVVVAIVFVLTLVLVIAVAVALPVISVMVLVCESRIRPQTQE